MQIDHPQRSDPTHRNAKSWFLPTKILPRQTHRLFNIKAAGEPNLELPLLA